MFLCTVRLVLVLSIIFLAQCHLSSNNILNISIAIVNARTVIACGLSIDIYSSFDPAQVINCPYVSIKHKVIQLIHMNATVHDEKKITIDLHPNTVSLPKILIDLGNGSFDYFTNDTRIYPRHDFYLSFLPELTCQLSSIQNNVTCFYYPSSIHFTQIEHRFNDIQHGSLVLSTKARNRFIAIFIIISILFVGVCFFAACIMCTDPYHVHHTNMTDLIIDSQVLRAEAAGKHPPEQLQDGAAGGQHAAMERLGNQEPQGIVIDVAGGGG